MTTNNTGAQSAGLLAAVLAGAPGLGSVRVSVVGLCKNAGKTVTLNHLIAAASSAGHPLHLISTGRDGEAEDAVTELPKPRIYAPPGSYVATTAAALDLSPAVVEERGRLPYHTSMGQVVLGRVRKGGEVLLVGPGNMSRLKEALAALEALSAADHAGATGQRALSLVDGSFDRIAAAAPSVTGTMVLAAGAAYSESMPETVAQVEHVLDLFGLPLAALPALPGAPVALVRLRPTTGEPLVEVLPFRSALVATDALVTHVRAAMGGPESTATGTLVLGGALPDSLLRALLSESSLLGRLTVAVRDATRILVDRSLWRRYRRLGGVAAVQEAARVAAVTCNPYSPVGRSYPPADFVAAIKQVAGQRFVADLEASAAGCFRSV